MNAKMHLPDTLGPGLVIGLDVAMLVKGKTGFYSIAQCNTSMLDSFRQLESMNQTYSTAIGAHMARPAISTSPSSTVKQWWRSMCASLGHGNDAEWRDNMQQYRWRALAKSDAYNKCYLETISLAKWEFFKLSRSQRI